MSDDAGGAPKQSKYVWVDASEHVFSPRVEFEGELLPTLSLKFDRSTVDSEPWQWFQVMDAPEKEYQDRATNTEMLCRGRHTCAHAWTQARASARLRAEGAWVGPGRSIPRVMSHCGRLHE